MSEFSKDDRQAICDTFERLLKDDGHEDALRRVIETESGFDDKLWQKMAELGLTAIMVDPKHDGVGGSIEDVEQLLEVAGAFLYNGPFVSTCVMAPVLLEACENQNLASIYLKKIALGKCVFAIAGCGADGDWTSNTYSVKSKKSVDEGWSLTGQAVYVVHGRNADYCMVYTQDGVFIVDAKNSGLSVIRHDANDPTLKISSLNFEGTPALKLDGVNEADKALALQYALVALAGEQVGATRRIFNMTIEYLNTRYQFGQPIGRFQALKHMAADLLIEVESASTVARHAARALASGAEDSALLTYLAAFTCADNFRAVAAEAIQLHGGIAYTMEHPAHLYWRRAQTGQWLFGSSDSFRDLYLTQMEAKL